VGVGSMRTSVGASVGVSVGVRVGGLGVLVLRMRVFVGGGGARVSVGGTGVSVGGMGVSVGGSAVSVGRGVLVRGMGVGASGVYVEGMVEDGTTLGVGDGRGVGEGSACCGWNVRANALPKRR